MKLLLLLVTLLSGDPGILFTSPSGVSCRLTARGNGAWRLQGESRPGAGFNDEGAVQALSSFLGEAVVDEALTVHVRGRKTLTAKSPDGSTAKVLSDGSLVFISASGREVLRIGSIDSGEGKVSVSGSLSEGEKVFGLGERLDRLDKSGQQVDVCTSDGWNDSRTSYMAIPMFSTTRGGGLFLNSYARSSMDFGADRSGVWTVVCDDSELDAYIFATDRIADVIKGYTWLSGAPGKPDTWNYGPIICRYNPDFMVLKGLATGMKNDTRFLGRGVVDIIREHCSLASRPSAVILEPWDVNVFSKAPCEVVVAERNADGSLKYLNAEKTDIATRTVKGEGDVGAALRSQSLRDAAEYLNNLGIHMMCYMRVGSAISKDAPGFKPEYMVSADIVSGGRTVAENTTLIPQTDHGTINPDLSRGGSMDYIDITNPEAWEWYVNTVWKELTDCGVEGMKIDFCELLPDDGVDYGGVSVHYKWHDPSVFANAEVHHAYPTFFVSALRKALEGRIRGGGNFMALTRGGGIGSQRNPFMWAGDQVRVFEKLDDQVLAVLNSSVSGVPWMTYDMAGYQYDDLKPEPVGVFDRRTSNIDLGRVTAGEGEEVVHIRTSSTLPLEKEARVFLRGTGFTAYVPCVQTHGFVRHAYEFDEATRESYKRLMDIHKELYPLFDRLADEAVSTGLPPVRPLALGWQDDPRACSVEDEFMLGDECLVAPILTDGSVREVYLPEGRWLEKETGREYDVPGAGLTIEVEAEPGVVPVFLKGSPDRRVEAGKPE
ncbi:MAG: glycoside hydrolase family 31 protein [Bacteroidales bacterium]|nr:glycoside hydrolase family 31 protein [Bacteroidales bacterium]